MPDSTRRRVPISLGGKPHLRCPVRASAEPDGAPRFLGLDDQGREVLSYVPGEAVTPPYPTWALTDQALESVAHLLRAYHDAVSSFDPAGGCRLVGDEQVSAGDDALDVPAGAGVGHHHTFDGLGRRIWGDVGQVGFGPRADEPGD